MDEDPQDALGDRMIQTTDVTSVENAVITLMTVPVVVVVAEEDDQGKKLARFFSPKCGCSLEVNAV